MTETIVGFEDAGVVLSPQVGRFAVRLARMVASSELAFGPITSAQRSEIGANSGRVEFIRQRYQDGPSLTPDGRMSAIHATEVGWLAGAGLLFWSW